jgi:hypothetical protein
LRLIWEGILLVLPNFRRMAPATAVVWDADSPSIWLLGPSFGPDLSLPSSSPEWFISTNRTEETPSREVQIG